MPSEEKDSSKEAYQVSVVTVSPLHVAAARGWAKMEDVGDQIHATFDAAYAAIEAQDVAHDETNVVIYRPEPGARFDVEGSLIEAGPIVPKPFAAKDGFVCAETPGGKAATTRHIGFYEELYRAHDAIMTWCGANGHVPTGICWEVYDQSGDDPAKLVTDVYYHLKG